MKYVARITLCKMVSYKLLTPEDVYFSGPTSVEEPLEESAEDKPPESLLLEKNTVCSTTTGFIALGTFLLVVCGVWLIGTIFWLQSPSGKFPHGPPPPGSASAPASSSAPQQGQGDMAPPPESCSTVSEAWRFDCYPERGVVVTQELCEARNCCFIAASTGTPPAKNGVPWCFYPPSFPTYTLDTLNDTDLGYTGQLTKKEKTYYPKDIETLQLDAYFETDSRLHVKVRTCQSMGCFVFTSLIS